MSICNVFLWVLRCASKEEPPELCILSDVSLMCIMYTIPIGRNNYPSKFEDKTELTYLKESHLFFFWSRVSRKVIWTDRQESRGYIPPVSGREWKVFLVSKQGFSLLFLIFLKTLYTERPIHEVQVKARSSISKSEPNNAIVVCHINNLKIWTDISSVSDRLKKKEETLINVSLKDIKDPTDESALWSIYECITVDFIRVVRFHCWGRRWGENWKLVCAMTSIRNWRSRERRGNNKRKWRGLSLARQSLMISSIPSPLFLNPHSPPLFCLSSAGHYTRAFLGLRIKFQNAKIFD